MIKVEIKKIDCTIKCHSCGNLIKKSNPVYILNINENNPFVICRDCGNGLQNDILTENLNFKTLGT